MYGWMFTACTVYALWKILRYVSSDRDHGTESETSKREPSLGSPSNNTCVRSSSCENNDRQDQPERTQLKYYNYYPNLPTSSSTTKRHGAVSLESEYVNKFMEGTDEASSRLNSRTSPPSFSSKPQFPKPASGTDCYILVEKGASNYKIPEDIEDLIKKDVVPDVLEKRLSPSTYKDYFAALLYAEDFYIQRWSDYQLFNVPLEVNEAAIYDKSLNNKSLKKGDEKGDKLFVAFEIDSVPERRPFLLSRDFVHARRSGSNAKEFQGILYRVVKSSKVLVEFEEDFYSLHHPKNRYDISFSFNRVCLKRAHQAIAAASRSLFENFLFPDFTTRKNISSSETCLYGNSNLDSSSNSAVRRLLSLQGSPPYLVEGPLCVTRGNLSETGLVVREAVLEIYKRSSKHTILVCAPINRTGDILMRSLKKQIPESDMFRANAAFREVDGVPVDILPLCLYEGGECFQLPSLQELMQFRVIFSTFTSSFRLHNVGIPPGHFSHIFLVDASSATEPETMIALTNLANENTTVILTGAPDNRPSWVRSDIARKNGLSVSYFVRLHAIATKTYSNFDPMFITTL